MRILFISDLLSYGGASKLIYDLLPIMKNQGNYCELLILTDKNSKYIDELNALNIKVTVVPKSAKGHWGRISYIKDYILRGHYDIIHANLFPTIYYCSIIKRILGKKCPPMVMTEHSTDNKRRHKPILRPLEQFMYKPYNTVICISEKTQENLCSWLKIKDKKRFPIIENGIDVEAFRNASSFDKAELFPEYKTGDILLLTVGSFTPQKNHKNLIKALNQLPKKYKLILAGEGELQDQIIKQVEDLHLNNRVVFLGFRKDIASIMHTADIMVIPSIWEGFGLIAVEAMACSIPVVASNVPGLAQVVGNAGLKFNPNNPEDIANVIQKISKKEVQQELCDIGNNTVEKYCIIKTCDMYIEKYGAIRKEKYAKL